VGFGGGKLEKIPVAILGATGMVGQRFVSLLYDHPQFEIEVLTASVRSSGEKYKDMVKWTLRDPIPDNVGEMKIQAMDFEIFKEYDVKVIFSALPKDIARDVEGNLATLGYYVFSNASTNRMEKTVPLLIADVNPHHLKLVSQQHYKPGFIVCNPNCTVTGLATALAPLKTDFGIKSVVVTTYQALSGAGYPGVSSLDICGNVLPFIPNEEEKVESECQKILGSLSESGITPSDFEVIANCARVPVVDGHLESVVVELKNDATEDEIIRSFTEFKGAFDLGLPTAPKEPIKVLRDENRPQPKLDLLKGEPKRAEGMTVCIGRVKKIHNKLRFFLLIHNTIRGASGCSIMNAELAKVNKYL
jgi:aspartate-semialdehyde dehydrogenase